MLPLDWTVIAPGAAREALLSALPDDRSWQLILHTEHTPASDGDPRITWLSPNTDPLAAALARATAPWLLIVNTPATPTVGWFAAHASARNAGYAAIGHFGWSPDITPTPLAVHLEAAPAHVGSEAAAAIGERFMPAQFAHVSLPRQALAEVCAASSDLAEPWRSRLRWYTLVTQGLDVRRIDATLLRERALDTNSWLSAIDPAAAGLLDAYLAAPDLVPWLISTTGPLLQSPLAPLSREQIWERLGRATSGAAIQEQPLLRLERRLLLDAWLAAVVERGLDSDPDFLPRRWHQAERLRRVAGPAAAAAELAPWATCAPYTVGAQVARWWLEAAAYTAATALADELACNPHTARSALPQLIAGEAALAQGELDAAEACFATAYHGWERELETASAIVQSFARYGPAPAARPHLERIAAATHTPRSGHDHRVLIAPALTQLERLRSYHQ